MEIRPIKTKADHRAALREIETLMAAERDTPEGERLDVLVTLVDRKSGYLLTGKMPNRTATRTREKIVSLLLPLPADHRHSLTFDNGKEFAEHEALAAATGMKIFFAQPYCSWQRGTNENTNGLVRQYLPKGTDLTAYSHHEVAAIQSSLNDRPRKRLGYLTPREVLTHNAARHSVAFGV